MSRKRRMFIFLSEESAEFIDKIPRGMKSAFLDALIREAKERFSSSEEMAQFILQKGLLRNFDRNGEEKKEPKKAELPKTKEKNSNAEKTEDSELEKLEKWEKDFY